MFEEIFNSLNHLEEKWRNLKDKFIENSISLDKKINSINSTLNEFDKILIARVNYINSLKEKVENNSLLINRNTISQSKNYIEKINKSIDGLINGIDSIQRSKGYQSIDYANFIITDRRGSQHNFSNYISSIGSNIESILDNFITLLPFLEIKGITDLTERSKEFERIVRIGNSKLKELEEIKLNIEKLQSELKDSNEKINSIRKESTESRKNITQNVQNISNFLEEAKSNIIKLKENVANSQSLIQIITELESKYKSLDKSQNERLNQIDKSIQNNIKAEETNLKREKEIDELIQKANSLMVGATSVGLAKSFSESNSYYKIELEGARKAFYISIFLLFLSSIPLLSFFVELPFPDWLSKFISLKSSSNYSGNLFNLFARVIILIPATWLTNFNSKRYNQLFKMQLDYQYRETISKSIDGFKKEAPKYNEEITAGVFVELNKNPALYLNKTSDDEVESPNIFNKILLNLIEKVDIFNKK